MPDRDTARRAQRDKRRGKSPGTQAGEFVREEIHHIRAGRHGARSAKQAIAIGLSEARRAGVGLKPPAAGTAGAKTRKAAARDSARGESAARSGSATRARSSLEALKREGHAAASRVALSAQARQAARGRSSSQRSAAARKAARTRGAART